ncbi:hypothetical protein Tco_1140140 [Tanacetum coccineum]
MPQPVVFSSIKPRIKLINFSKTKSYSSSTGLKTKKPNHLLRKPLLSLLKVAVIPTLTKIITRIDAMTMKMDAQYKDFQSHSKQPNFDDDDIPMSREEEAKFMQTFRLTRFYNDYRDRDSNRDNWRSSRRNDYNRDNYQFHSDNKPDLQKQLSDFKNAQHSTNSFVKDTFMDLKNKIETTTKNHQALIQNLEANVVPVVGYLLLDPTSIDQIP